MDTLERALQQPDLSNYSQKVTGAQPSAPLQANVVATRSSMAGQSNNRIGQSASTPTRGLLAPVTVINNVIAPANAQASKTIVRYQSATVPASTTSTLVRTVTANTTVSYSDAMVLCDCSAGAITVTLPSPIGGSQVNIKKIDSSLNSLTISGTIDGYSSVVTSVQGTSLDLKGDGSKWRII